jgi:N-glycosylase/DNA lyase
MGIVGSMKLEFTQGKAVLYGAGFSIRETFDCGQCFRFEQKENAYEGVAMGAFLRVEELPDAVTLFTCTPEDFEAKWRHYFDLDRD